jgi:hypothetical protein
MYTPSEVAEALGLLTKGGHPHTALAKALLRQIKAQPIAYHDGKPVYGHCVLSVIRATFGQAVNYELPECVEIRGRRFHVRYWPEESVS